MSELEARMAIGQKMHTIGETEGDRTVTYDQNGKQWKVTYVNNKATEIKSE
jgi:outer membrane biogenesis lipoprotein LolB